jgi:hypothetical protein
MIICRNICQIYVAFRRVTIPAKHGVDSFRKLPVARFIDTASVHPEVL